jgi:hypothetical protein
MTPVAIAEIQAILARRKKAMGMNQVLRIWNGNDNEAGASKFVRILAARAVVEKLNKICLRCGDE